MKIMIVLSRTSPTQYTFWVTIVREKKALTWEKFYGVVVFWNQPQLCRDGTQRWIRFAAFIIHMQLQQNEHEILPWKWSINFKHSWRRKGWPGGAGRAITLNDSALLLMRQESKKNDVGKLGRFLSNQQLHEEGVNLTWITKVTDYYRVGDQEEAEQGDREHQWWLWRGENLTAHWGLSLTWIDLQTHTCTAYSRKSFFISDIFIFGEVLAARENSPDASPSHFRNFVNVVPLDLVSFIGSFDSFMTSTFRAKPASNFQYKGVKLSQHSMVLWYSVSFY